MTRLEIDAMPKDLVLLQGEIFVLEKDYELERILKFVLNWRVNLTLKNHFLKNK